MDASVESLPVTNWKFTGNTSFFARQFTVETSSKSFIPSTSSGVILSSSFKISMTTFAFVFSPIAVFESAVARRIMFVLMSMPSS